MSMIMEFLRVSKDELKEYIENSELLEERVFSEDIDEDDNLLDLQKSWDGIAFLLTGKGATEASGELSNIMFSDKLIDEEQDMGYGPACYVDSDEVKNLNNTISKISIKELKEKFDPNKMNQLELYPGDWDRGEEELEYLLINFKDLQAFYQKAANENQAIITMLS